jgi:hypothetical protein
MKLFIKIMLLVVVAALAGPFIIKGPNGGSLMTLEKLGVPAVSMPDFGKAAAVVKASVSQAGASPAEPIAVYKWRDDYGRWHFSDKAQRGRSAQIVDVDPGNNVVHFAAADNSRSAAPTGSGADNQHDSGAVLTGASAAIGTLSDLMGAAKNVGPLQAQRAARQEHAMQE